MKIQINAKSELLDSIQKDHAQKKVLFILRRFEEMIDSIHIKLEDLNGPRGGVDKRCLINVTCSGNSDCIARFHHANPLAAIVGATNTIKRQLSRTRSRREKNYRAINYPSRYNQPVITTEQA